MDAVKFSCNGCSLCCRFKGGVVMLSKDDLSRLALWAELTEEQFIKVYCQWIENSDGKEYLCLKTMHRNPETDDCIFWDSTIPGCQCYSARPVQCSTYPFWTKIVADKESWNAEKKHCPGINEGDIHTSEEIHEELKKYQSRIPVTR